MLVLLLHYLLTHPVMEAKPLPQELMPLEYDDCENLEEADIITHRIANAALEQIEAEAAFRINELLDRLEINP